MTLLELLIALDEHGVAELYRDRCWLVLRYRQDVKPVPDQLVTACKALRQDLLPRLHPVPAWARVREVQQ